MQDLKFDYDEKSPITGNMSVLVEEIEENIYQKICIESGYYTQSDWKAGSETVDKVIDSIPKHNIDVSKVDESGNVWFPYYLTTSKTTMFANDFGDGFKWFVGPIQLSENESESVVENSSAKSFDKDQFTDALNHFYILENR